MIELIKKHFWKIVVVVLVVLVAWCYMSVGDPSGSCGCM